MAVVSRLRRLSPLSLRRSSDWGDDSTLTTGRDYVFWGPKSMPLERLAYVSHSSEPAESSEPSNKRTNVSLPSCSLLLFVSTRTV